MGWTRQEKLEAALASPRLADAHDRDGWLALYSADAEVADPVGTPASRGREEIGRFYDAFIRSNRIHMDTVLDIVCGMDVFRQVVIHTEQETTGMKMAVPANLVYQLRDEQGRLMVKRMHAHWAMRNSKRTSSKSAWRQLRFSFAMFWGIVRAKGLRWMRDYLKGVQGGIGGRGVKRVMSLAGQPGAEAFTEGALVTLPGGESVDADTFCRDCQGLQPGEMTGSGYTVSGLAELEWQGQQQQAALVADFKPGDDRIAALSVWWETG